MKEKNFLAGFTIELKYVGTGAGNLLKWQKQVI